MSYEACVWFVIVLGVVVGSDCFDSLNKPNRPSY